MRSDRRKLGVGMIAKLTLVLMITTTTMGVFAQAKPDLVVSGLTVEHDASGQAVARVSVTVSNACRGTSSEPTFVLVTFKESEQPGSKAIYFVGSKVRPLKGGESQTLMFEASGKHIELTRHVLAEVDPYRKVGEKSESNNWRTLNPSAAGAAGCSK